MSGSGIQVNAFLALISMECNGLFLFLCFMLSGFFKRHPWVFPLDAFCRQNPIKELGVLCQTGRKLSSRTNCRNQHMVVGVVATGEGHLVGVAEHHRENQAEAVLLHGRLMPALLPAGKPRPGTRADV